MSEQFKEYVTGGAFQLSLSRRQTEMICHIDQFGWTYGYVSTCGALIGKGLCERVMDGEFPKVQLTEAGRAVVPLLKLAGLYERFDLPEFAEAAPIEIKITRKASAKDPVEQQ